jgi:hypothetical protein
MSRTIKAIERHMILPVRLGPRSRIPSVRSKTCRGELGLQSRPSKLVVEWQKRFRSAIEAVSLPHRRHAREYRTSHRRGERVRIQILWFHRLVDVADYLPSFRDW